MPFQHHQLRIFGEAVDWVLRVHHLTRSVPADWRYMSEQVRRAAGSVPLNIAEGNGERGREKCRFFRIARRSVAESEAGIYILHRAGIIPTDELNDAQHRLNGMSARLHALIAACSPPPP